MNASRNTLCPRPTLLLILLLAMGCSSEDNSQPAGPAGPGPETFSWGQIIEVPEISPGAEGDNVSELKTTNEGVYMKVTRGIESEGWIYRLQNGESPSWIFHKQPDVYFDWEPSNELTESPDEFTIFFQTLERNGFASINTGIPALLDEENPSTGGILSFTGKMLIDNSSGANKWAFFGSEVKIKNNTDVGDYKTICTLPQSGGIILAEADPHDAVVWAANDHQLYRITVNGDITVFDVGSYSDPSIFGGIGKIRFCYDVLHQDVYFRYQNKVFRITGGNSLSLFHTISNESNFLGGDFCVDHNYMYATDGTKKSLTLGTVGTFIPDEPSTASFEILFDYVTKKGAIAVGPIEVSKNPLDPYIYVASNCRIFKIPKSF